MLRSITAGSVCVMIGFSGCGQSSSGAATTRAGGRAVSVGTANGSDPRATVPGGAGSPATGLSAGGTRPEAEPGRGGRQTTFVVRLTVRAQLGARGVLSAEYRVSAAGPSAPGCVAMAARTLNHGRVGERVTVAFAPPQVGWCAGAYRGVIYLERGPHCTKRPGSAQSPVCPEFASQLVEVGRFGWQVR